MKIKKVFEKLIVTIVVLIIIFLIVLSSFISPTSGQEITSKETQNTYINTNNDGKFIDPEVIILYTSSACKNCEYIVNKVNELEKSIQIKNTDELETQKELISLCKKEGVKDNCGFVPLLVAIKQGKYYSVIGVDNILDYISESKITQFNIENNNDSDSGVYYLIGVGIFLFGILMSLLVMFKEFKK